MLATRTDILNALAYYDTHKGFGRRYIYGDQTHITELRAFASQLTNETLTDEQIKHCYLLIAKRLRLAQSIKKSLSYTIFKSLAPRHFTDDYQSITQASLIYDLNEARLLTHENLSLTLGIRVSKYIAQAFSQLREAGLLTAENVAIIFANEQHSYSIAQAFCELNKANLLTAENIAAIFANVQHSYSIAHAFRELKEANLLTAANRAAIVVNARHSYYIAQAFCKLNNANLLTAENRAAIIANAGVAYILTQYIILLTRSNILNAENVSNILKHARAMCMTRLIDYIPQHLFTQTFINQLIEICERSETITAAQRAIDQAINRLIRPHREDARALNNAQNTHTASVHRTVSESAKRLKDHYNSHLNSLDTLSSTLAEVQRYLNTLDPTDIKNRAAISALVRIISDGDVGDYKDATSGVTVRRLVALLWIAIQDDSKRTATLIDAKLAMRDALYEIQRGYNINDAGVDTGGADRPICASGTFNKLIEKFVSIHPYARLEVITSASAGLRLPRVVNQVMHQFLKTQKAKITPKAFIELIKKVREDGAEAIWDKIKPEIVSLMLEEFGSIYPGGEANANFTALINCGLDITLPEGSFDSMARILACEAAAGAGAEAGAEEDTVVALD